MEDINFARYAVILDFYLLPFNRSGFVTLVPFIISTSVNFQNALRLWRGTSTRVEVTSDNFENAISPWSPQVVEAAEVVGPRDLEYRTLSSSVLASTDQYDFALACWHMIL